MRLEHVLSMAIGICVVYEERLPLHPKIKARQGILPSAFPFDK